MAKHSTEDVPLPGTLWFVMVMGAAFFIGWFAMYFLLRSRW